MTRSVCERNLTLTGEVADMAKGPILHTAKMASLLGVF